MTTEQCNRCKYAPAPGTYSECSGDDLPVWSCEKDGDLAMPFDMDENTICPCFRPIDAEKETCYYNRYGYCNNLVLQLKNGHSKCTGVCGHYVDWKDWC